MRLAAIAVCYRAWCENLGDVKHRAGLLLMQQLALLDSFYELSCTTENIFVKYR